ncbi:MAG: hypothetical protein JW809_08715 [Pirellulales bacterium]|nr:hypothetical protein [Pirellulales bacterium]
MTQASSGLVERQRSLLVAADARLSNAETVAYLIVVVGAIILVGVAIWVINRLVHRWRYNSHAGLYRALCQAHHLSRAQRSLLTQVARYHGLARPGRLFTDPRLLDPGRLAKAFSARRSELARLRTQLFEEPKPEGDAATAETPSAEATPQASG